MMFQQPSLRREKILWITREQFFAMLGICRTRLVMPNIEGLPNNVQYRAVCYDFHRDAFGVRVEHESFPEVAAGAELPWTAALEIEMRELRFIEIGNKYYAVAEPVGQEAGTFAELETFLKKLPASNSDEAQPSHIVGGYSCTA